MPRNEETQELSQDRRARRPEPYQQVQSTRSGRGTATFDQTPHGVHQDNGGGSSAEASRPSGEDGSELTPRPLQCRVAVAELVETADQAGNSATMLVPNAVGGGLNTNWWTTTPQGCVWGVTQDENAVLDRFRQARNETYARNIGYILIPQDPVAFEEIKRNETQSRVVKSNGRDDNGQPAGLVAPKTTQIPVEANDNCPWCPQGGHSLINCIYACPAGELEGCAICNTQSHIPMTCDVFENMSLRDKVIWSVVKRANKPALRTRDPWYVMLHEWCNIVTYDSDLIKGFPWSKGFAQYLFREQRRLNILALQNRYDANRDRHVLPVDPATASFYMVWKTYWEPEGLAWPSVLGQNADAENTRGDDVDRDVSPDSEFNGFDDFGSQAGAVSVFPPQVGAVSVFPPQAGAVSQ